MKFSIVIPVYNVEKYLKECIDSFIAQTYENYELILVDDGSKDSSGQICDQYKEKCSKVKVIHQENGGLSIARNSGIFNSTGDYILFIDSDDYICDNNFLNEIYQILNEKKSDMLIFGHKKYFESNGKVIEKKEFVENPKEKNINSLISQNYLKASACDKVIKRDIIMNNNIFFPENRFSEDIKWCADLLEYINVENISVLNSNVYVYRQRANSITKTVKEKNIIDMYEMIYEKYNDTQKDYIKNFLAYEYAVVLGLMEITENVNKELKQKIYDLQDILDYNLSSKVRKVKLLKSVLGIRMTSKILGMYINIK